MIKHEKHVTDNRASISKNSNDFLSLFSKIFEDKVNTSFEKVYENALIQNEKPQRDEKCYLRPAIMRIFLVAGIQKQSPGGVSSKTLPLIILKNS